jgi:hypothetical protein
MTPASWLKARGVELAAALCTVSLLIGGLAIGVPFLRARIPETFLYSFCCLTAVILRALIDLAVRCLRLALGRIPARHIVISPLSRYPAGVVR